MMNDLAIIMSIMYIGVTSLMVFFVWDGFTYLNPQTIYDKTKLNWFGTLLVSLFIYVALPHIVLVYCIVELCTMGRKKE